ncbi:MAG: ribonuclease Z [Flammeovirgaceae bacterium]
MKFEVTILGSNAATYAYGRHMTAQVVNHKERLFLIDCAEGTQMQLADYKIKKGKIDAIFISHLHGDHHFGLAGLLSSFHLMGRTAPLKVFAPKGLDEILTVTFRHSKTILSYPLQFTAIDTARFQQIYENDYLEVFTIPLEHRIECAGFLFREKPKPRKILADKLPTGFPFSLMDDLKAGNDVEAAGKVYKNKELTADPKPSHSYAYCSDTRYSERIIPKVANVDLLYHEATFLDEEAKLAAKTYHTTTKQAAKIAKLAYVKKLLIGHFSARYDDLKPCLLEAQAVFPESYLAIEGETFVIS